MKYPENIMSMVRESFGLEPDDISRDGEIDLMTNREIFEAMCNYEGLIGYADTIIGWINQIYGLDLNGGGGMTYDSENIATMEQT